MEIVAENKNARVKAVIEVTPKMPPLTDEQATQIRTFFCSRIVDLLSDVPFLACYSLSVDGVKVRK